MKNLIYWVLIVLMVIASFIAFNKEAHGDVYPNWITIDHPDTCREAAEIIFKDAPIMLKVMKAESGGNHLAKNKNSTASGCFQILKSTWKDAKCSGDVFNPIDNTRCARKLYNQSRLSPWEESRPSWSK